MVTRKQQGEFHATYPGEYRIAAMVLPKPHGRKYSEDEAEIVNHIKRLDAKQRSLRKQIADKEALYRQRLFGTSKVKKGRTAKPGVMTWGSKEREELMKLSVKIDSLANEYSVVKHDKKLQITRLGHLIMSKNLDARLKKRM